MPTYQYACTNTEGKHEFEVVQSFSDPALTECVECGAPVRKVYGSVGVVFKGSGFYRTDSRNGSSSSSSSKAATGSSSSGDSSSNGSSSGDSGSSTSTPAPATTSSGSGSSGSSTAG
ncbi:FmdB family zinc ribbon protein [Blastococcus sp. CCUG 61487]|uniref:FmdB family zinc ribbon protein n=1 Tax=Blastococcus sp. CCUG 61487 TaxID=1840703 RepID=UPI0010BFAA53|nr:FmdB family zinc ribbon protein [Blastococcus sp. CCUG 61487]